MDIFKAIQSIRPGARFAVSGNSYEGLEWFDDNELPPPTEQEVYLAVIKQRQEWENTQYQRDRFDAYPSIQDQLDMLYHKGYDGWKEEINKIKEQYPKPE